MLLTIDNNFLFSRLKGVYFNFLQFAIMYRACLVALLLATFCFADDPNVISVKVIDKECCDYRGSEVYTIIFTYGWQNGTSLNGTVHRQYAGNYFMPLESLMNRVCSTGESLTDGLLLRKHPSTSFWFTRSFRNEYIFTCNIRFMYFILTSQLISKQRLFFNPPTSLIFWALDFPFAKELSGLRI